MIGKTISHYKILEEIGSGGMGIVYKAEDTDLKRTVALKFLPPELLRDKEAKERFTQEAQAASALDHPNICNIFAIDETDDGQMFIAMGYYEGETLKDKIAQKPFPLEEAIDIVIQIAQGLTKAHEKGITHRDIKPANIIITRDNVVKILDFGLAKLSGQTKLTKADSTLGTVAYMSPEQTRGDLVDYRTDIWSLGVVLYEMLTGQLPFKGDYEQAVVYSILNEDPKPLPNMQSTISKPLQSIIDKALAKEPIERYQNMEEILSDLHCITDDKRPFVKALTAERHTVGREKELNELRGCLQDVFAGRTQIFCVVGEPGIGKTTLVEEFLDELNTSGLSCTIACGRCSERLSGTEAYLPFLEVLESLLDSQLNGSVTKTMREIAPWWYAQVVSLSTDDPSDARLLESVRNATQERVKRELTRFLQELSRLKPLVFFFDDLHWSDVSTIDMLAYLSSKFNIMRIMLVTTYRPAELLLAKHPFLQIKPDLLSRGVCRELELSFLTCEEIECYLALEYPFHDFPADFPKLIHDRTEGCPLFMADLVRYLQNRDVIHEEGGRWTLLQSVAEIQLELPESVRGMIQRKIDQLSDDDRHLLMVASVQGYEFDTAVVGHVLEIDEEEIEERLQLLDRDHRFVQLIAEADFPDHTLTLRYRFVHVLYQNELYASLTRTKRARLSKTVAEALLGYYGEQRAIVASELSILFETARDFPRAMEYFYIAAQNASKVFAYQEAITLARRGLKLLENLSDLSDKAQHELNLQIAMAVALIATRGWGDKEVGLAYSRSRELCKKVGETPQLIPVLWGLFGYYFVRAEHQTAREIAEQSLKLAQHEQDDVLLMIGRTAVGFSSCVQGKFTTARDHLDQVSALYHPQRHHSLAFTTIGVDPGIQAGDYTAWIRCVLGYPDQALKQIQEVEALALELSDVFGLSHVLCVAFHIYYYCREKSAAQNVIKRLIEIATEHGLLFFLAWAMPPQGWALAMNEDGKTEEGIELTRKGLETYLATGSDYVMPFFLTLLADVYGKAGQTKKGLATIEEALTRVNKTDERHHEADLNRLKGELLLMQGELDSEAESCFHQALDVARLQEAKFLELRAAMSLSRLWQKQGKQEEAKKLLREIYNWFTEGFGTKDLQEAKALLAEL